MKLLLWLILLVLCWPLALLALLLYPIVWLLTLPFRLLGIAVEGVFEFLRTLACIFHGDAFESGWMGVRFFVRLTSECRDIHAKESGKAHV